MKITKERSGIKKIDNDDDDYITLRRNTKKYISPVNSPTYEEECGACHFPYQPELLPSGSWKKKDKYKLSILRVVKKLVPIDPTPLIIRTALGTILMFLLLTAHELAGVGGMVLVCILFAIGVSAPFWLTRRKKH